MTPSPSRIAPGQRPWDLTSPRTIRGHRRVGQLAELKRRRRFLHRTSHRPTLPLTRARIQRIHRGPRIDEDGTRARMSLGDVARLARDRAVYDRATEPR